MKRNTPPNSQRKAAFDALWERWGSPEYLNSNRQIGRMLQKLRLAGVNIDALATMGTDYPVGVMQWILDLLGDYILPLKKNQKRLELAQIDDAVTRFARVYASTHGAAASVEAKRKPATPAGKNEPLSKNARAVYKMLKSLPRHEGMTGPMILDGLANKGIFVDQSTLTKRIIPKLRAYGVANKPRLGYFLTKR